MKQQKNGVFLIVFGTVMFVGFYYLFGIEMNNPMIATNIMDIIGIGFYIVVTWFGMFLGVLTAMNGMVKAFKKIPPNNPRK